MLQHDASSPFLLSGLEQIAHPESVEQSTRGGPNPQTRSVLPAGKDKAGNSRSDSALLGSDRRSRVIPAKYEVRQRRGNTACGITTWAQSSWRNSKSPRASLSEANSASGCFRDEACPEFPEFFPSFLAEFRRVRRVRVRRPPCLLPPHRQRCATPPAGCPPVAQCRLTPGSAVGRPPPG